MNIEMFLDAYITAALWSSTDDAGEPLDDNFGPGDIDATTLASMREDCEQFIASSSADLALYAELRGNAQWSADELAGHDFWLTRNGHGAGFWDRGLGELGRRLTDAAHAFGQTDLYVGDDGKVHA